MDKRREIMEAVAQLTERERCQLLLYLLEEDFRALEIIDGRKWRYYEVHRSVGSPPGGQS
jgi:hypothetical protein